MALKVDRIYKIIIYRIGNLAQDDVSENKAISEDDPFANEPKRHPVLKVNSQKPFNAEPPLEYVMTLFIVKNSFM